MGKVAFITGILGQDGAYLAKFLLDKDYQVYGLVRRYTNPNYSNLEYLKIKDKINLVPGDMIDEGSMFNIINQIRPTEVYNLAAQSFVGTSWEQPRLTTEVNALGTLYLLNAIKNVSPKSKFYQASTSEMFGNKKGAKGIRDENTPFHPRSPYAISKLYAHWITNNFKESFGLFCCNGILFNHESPIRGKEFVTRKITDAVARIKLGLADSLKLGTLDTKRDWGFAGDYVEAMWLMLQHHRPDNYVVSTGESHSIREFCQAAFNHVGINDWEKYVSLDPSFKRPAEVYGLLGNSEKARKVLKWDPKVNFKQLVEMMVDADLKRYKSQDKNN
jgi:GDPmannose 4,6-dehydratase